MNNLEHVNLVVRQKQSEESRREKNRRLRQSLARGQLPTIEELARARGLVVREREHSIFSDAWVPLAVLFLVGGFIAGRNIAFLALGAALLLIVAFASWYRANALINVTYERQFDRTHVFPGEPIVMTLRVRNQKALPLTWLQFRDDMPLAPEEASDIARVQGETTGHYVLQNTFAIGAHEQRQRAYTLRFHQRGFKAVGPVVYASGDLFTLFTVEQERDDRETLVVYPRVWPLSDLGLPAKEPFGPLPVRRSLFADPERVRGVRDYQPEDRFRDVHWKATARRGSLQTKVYEPATDLSLAIFLNVATMPRHWQGHYPELLERAISVAGSIANHAAERGWAFGIYANGSVPRSDQPIRLPPGRNPDQLTHALEALAAVTEFATGSIERLMGRESPRLPWAATLVLVTAVLTEEILVGLLRLHEAGRRLALLYLGDALPEGATLPFRVYHLPGSLPAFGEAGPGSLETIPSPAAQPGPIAAAT